MTRTARALLFVSSLLGCDGFVTNAPFRRALTISDVRSRSVTLEMAREPNVDGVRSRRDVMKTAFGAVLSAGIINLGGADPARAGLLDDYGAEPNKIVQKAAPPPPVMASSPDGPKKGETGIDPTLKGTYYYPTAKKRYLPRIKKVSDAISTVPEAIAESRWDEVSLFADKVADDAVLPLKLYTSSLDGQGLGMKNEYVKTMKTTADCFEKNTKDLQKSVKSKNKEKATVAISEMGNALSQYREAGKLTGPDAGGDIPSIDEMRRMAMRRPTTAIKRPGEN